MALLNVGIWSRVAAGLLLGCTLAVGPTAAAAADGVSRERQIKAAFLYNFTKFIDWPENSFAAADSPFVIGAYCDELMCAELERVVAGRKVGTHPIVVRRLADDAQAPSAHLVYVCAHESRRVAAIAEQVAAQPVLTVSESETSARGGATIVFVLVDDKVRFEIDAASAERATVKISAQLMKLARSVHRS